MHEKVSILKTVNVTASNTTEVGKKEMVDYVSSSPLTVNTDGPIPVIPVLTHGTEKFFVDNGNISYVKHSRGVSYQTGPLVVGQALNLFGLSQANDFVSAGDLDVASTISPDASLSAIYINVLGSVLRYNIEGWKETAGVAMMTGDSRGLNFLFRTDRFIINERTRDVYGKSPDWVRQLHLADMTLSLRVNFSGVLKTAKGNVEFGSGKVEVLTVDVFDTSTNEKLKAVIGSLFDDISIVGYELNATFTNQ